MGDLPGRGPPAVGSSGSTGTRITKVYTGSVAVVELETIFAFARDHGILKPIIGQKAPGDVMSSQQKVELTHFLNQQYLCESLTVKEIETLLDYTELVHYRKNEMIADIGDVGEALYFVVNGEAALYYDDGREEHEVGRMTEGELMGEMSFFDRKPRSARIRAKADDTRILLLSRPKYQRLRVEHPYVAVNLLEHAVISLDHLFRRVSSDVASYAQYLRGGGGIRK